MRYLLGAIYVWTILIVLPCADAQSLTIPVDTQIVSRHTTRILDKTIEYEATAGMQPVWNAKGEIIATLFYTYYKRLGIEDMATRPIAFSFNGGPGSASAWMHIGYTGPKLLKVDEDGYPVQPYGIEDNPYSILDVCDIVYVNPVNTAYSRMVPNDGEGRDRKEFFGINADIQYLAKWMTTFVTRNNRWLSPKYLIGESYGGTRVSGLANQLQGNQWMYLNGVILVSPADYKVFESDDPIPYALNLPYYAATAWYHKRLPDNLQDQSLESILPDIEAFALDEYLPALTKGASLDEKTKMKLASQLADRTGLSTEDYADHNLRVPLNYFWKSLLRDQGEQYSTGRLDSRYLGLDKQVSGHRPDYNAELTTWSHVFAPAINYYISQELKFVTDMPYLLFGDVHPWDKSNNDTREALRKAMATNPFLHIMFQVGYFDGGTTYFASKYTFNQLDPSGKLKDRMDFKKYHAGHMMYMRREDLQTANEDLRKFILASSSPRHSAKYERN